MYSLADLKVQASACQTSQQPAVYQFLATWNVFVKRAQLAADLLPLNDLDLSFLDQNVANKLRLGLEEKIRTMDENEKYLQQLFDGKI